MTTQEYAERALTLRENGGRWEVVFSFLDPGTVNPPPSAFMVLGFGDKEQAANYRQAAVHVLEHVVRFALGAYSSGLLTPKEFPELREGLKKEGG